ncbi:LytR family transcriptional regulator [Streptococcus halotolerans]|uniref:LytR family transcriptional regulator n=1 Tax=Streptococcus halotolerans TaxID=1814128 RepID=UPI000787BCDE|nr:LytR family transcriptional regulator [Streptococcus halotolerans]
MTIDTDKIAVLLDLYAYHHLSEILDDKINAHTYFLLESLKERRELNVAYLFKKEYDRKQCEAYFNHDLVSNPYEKELLANYIFDLEAKLRNGKIIDFVRAVSPILYRLFLEVLEDQVPELDDYIHNAKSSQYDTWNFHKMHASDNKAIISYVSQKRDGKVTSSSLSELIQHTDLDETIKKTVSDLREFEKSVRNPLAHLIQSFDEEELHRTTGFSSQAFLAKIIDLALYCDVVYDRDNFYFDQMNHLILRELHSSKTEK